MEHAEHSVGLLFEAIAEAVGDREAIVQRDGPRRTYAQLLDRTRRLASVFETAGLGPHRATGPPASWEAGCDLILLYLTNCAEYLEGMLGSFLARVGPANVNYRYTAEEVAHLVGDSQARAAIVHARYADTLLEAAALAGRTLDLVLVVDDGSRAPLPPGTQRYEDVIASADASALRARPSPDDLYIVYTGGTTGRPKGVLWRQADFIAGALGVDGTTERLTAAAAAAPPNRLRTLLAPPLMHGAAHWNALSGITSGGTAVLPARPDRVDPDDLLDTIALERCTALNIVGDAFAIPLADAQEARPRDLSSLRHVVSGGATLSVTTKARLEALAPGLRVVDIVGSSESGRQGVARGSGPTRFRPAPSSVVLDDARGRVLGVGDTGEVGWLAATGPIPRGYLGDEAKTAATFPTVDGVRYVVAGDRARLTGEGIELLGRDSVTITTGGEKVFAEEVEEVVRSHPAVFDAVVVGRPSPRWGQEVVAVIALRSGAEVSDEELRHAAALRLARYKLPKAVVRVEAVQRTASGKPDYAWARRVATDAGGRATIEP